MVSDFLPGLANVGSSSKHAFESHDSDSEIVDTGGVVYSAHNLWCHVTWSSGRVLSILRSPDSGNTEISNSEVSFFIYDQVLGFDVSVDDVLLVTDL